MGSHIRLHSLSDCVVFFDFDNTITPFDVLDDIIERFSVTREWVRLERLWRKGKIGSRECLTGQLAGIRVSKKRLRKYISTIKLDKGFHRLITLLRKEGIRPIILSDSFHSIIREILKNNGVNGIRIYSNTARFRDGRIRPLFSYTNERCGKCAHCKKKNLLEKSLEDKLIIYIGDGLSDICAALNSDIIFAKGSLLRYLRRRNKLCIEFKDLGDIYKYLEVLKK